MQNEFSRTKLLVGDMAMDILKNSSVIVFGVGGVGGYVCEALARSGVGHICIVDADTVSKSNINRQIIATHKTVGLDKVSVMRDRILSINPLCDVDAKKCFFLPSNADEFDFSNYSYVVDCVDTVTAKVSIITKACEAGIPVISAMGAGNKMNPADLCVSDIYKTEVDPLARVMRAELKKRGIKKLKVVYSKEIPIKPMIDIKDSDSGKVIPGSNAFVPSAMGLIIASEVFKDLISYKK